MLHVRTKKLPLSQSHAEDATIGPIVQAYIPKSPTPLVTPSAPIMSREHSGGQVQGKRAGGGRKSIPSNTAPENVSHGSVEEVGQRVSGTSEVDETLEQLADRLKSLQQENESLEKQVAQEDKEHEQMLRELEEQRNGMRQKVKEKDEASGDLRKHVNKLENVNRTVQSERSKRERLIQQKEVGRKKRKEDIIRWEEQAKEMDEERSRCEEVKASIEAEAANQIEQLKEKIFNEQTEMKALEEDIKDKGSRIKKMEEERRRLEGDDTEDARELDRLERERAQFWEMKMSNLRTQYTSLLNVHSQVLFPSTLLASTYS